MLTYNITARNRDIADGFIMLWLEWVVFVACINMVFVRTYPQTNILLVVIYTLCDLDTVQIATLVL